MSYVLYDLICQATVTHLKFSEHQQPRNFRPEDESQAAGVREEVQAEDKSSDADFNRVRLRRQQPETDRATPAVSLEAFC